MSREENEGRLRQLLGDVLFIAPEQCSDSHGPAQIATWDSLATVSMAVGLNEIFGHHMTPEEVGEIRCIGDIKTYLRRNGVEI